MKQEEEPAEEMMETGVSAERMDMRWLFDTQMMCLEFEAKLRGGKLKKNDMNKEWEIDLRNRTTPFMNERGINDVIGLYKMGVNMVTASSIILEDRVLMWCERMQIDLASMLYVHLEDYDLDAAKYDAIITLFMVNFEFNLRKSIGGKALLWATNAERRVISESVNPAGPNSFWGRLGKRAFG